VIARFVMQALQGDPLTVYGDGEQTRSFTYVEDTVRGTVAAMAADGAAGQAFNVGRAEETSINALAGQVRDLVGADVDIRHIPYDQAYDGQFEETRRRMPDVARARDLLGFEAQTPLDRGLDRTIQWFKEHRDERI
jgi:UDP-glucose 4-epimerase